MHKTIFTGFLLLGVTLAAIGQSRMEHIVIAWPAEYNWKTVRTTHHDNVRVSMIIPGSESAATASIMGSLTTYEGTTFADVAGILSYYKARIDAGTRLTVIGREQKTAYPWIIFKVETPASAKYPVAESGLYYVVQGKLALYENYVAIKADGLSDEFVKKWTGVFMTGKVVTD
jgi:hypothetical protein